MWWGLSSSKMIYDEFSSYLNIDPKLPILYILIKKFKIKNKKRNDASSITLRARSRYTPKNIKEAIHQENPGARSL